MSEFTPVSALLGGILIGLSALVLMAGNGRIAGISGIVGTALGSVLERIGIGARPRAPGDSSGGFSWRLAFILALMAGALFSHLLIRPVPLAFDAGWPAVILGGLAVGYGTLMGSGCTSGHGVCGLARFSKRSLVATLVFMAVAMATVFVTRHLLGN